MSGMAKKFFAITGILDILLIKTMLYENWRVYLFFLINGPYFNKVESKSKSNL